MTLLIALRAIASSDAPCHSGGYSIAPTPMIAPWPFISRGTEWLVPMVPGLVREIVVPWKSSTVSLSSRALRTTSSYAVQNAAKSIVSAALIDGTSSWRVPSGFCMSMARPRLMWAGVIRLGLPSIDVEADVHLGHRLERLDQRVADQVGERDLAAAGAGEVVVDDGAVVPEQLDRDRAHRGGGRHGQRGVHVLRGPGRGAAEHRVRRLVAGGGGVGAAARPSAPGWWCPSAGSAALASGRGLATGAGAGVAASTSAGAVSGAAGSGSARRCASAPAWCGCAAAGGAVFVAVAPGPRRGSAGAAEPFAAAVSEERAAHSGSTLLGSFWYCSRISSTSHSLAPNSPGCSRAGDGLPDCGTARFASSFEC